MLMGMLFYSINDNKKNNKLGKIFLNLTDLHIVTLDIFFFKSGCPIS